MGMIQAFLKTGTDFAKYAIESEADAKASDLQAREYERAMRTIQAQRVDALTRGAGEAGQIRMAGSALEGKQRLAYAASGIDATSGTAAQTIESSAVFSELDAATAVNNARREALGHRLSEIKLIDENQRRAQARINRATSRDMELAGSYLSVLGAFAKDAAGGV